MFRQIFRRKNVAPKKSFKKNPLKPLDKAPKILYLCKRITNTKDIRNIYEGYTKHKRMITLPSDHLKYPQMRSVPQKNKPKLTLVRLRIRMASVSSVERFLRSKRANFAISESKSKVLL